MHSSNCASKRLCRLRMFIRLDTIMALFFGYWYGKCHFEHWTHKVSQLLSFKSSAKINNVWYCFNNVLKMCSFHLFIAVSWQNWIFSVIWRLYVSWFQTTQPFWFYFFSFFSFWIENASFLCELKWLLYEFKFFFLWNVHFPLHFLQVSSFCKSPSIDHRVYFKVFIQGIVDFC